MPIIVHPAPFACQVTDHVPRTYRLGWERMRRLHISNYLGFAFEYMVALASLTLGGVFKEFPKPPLLFLRGWRFLAALGHVHAGPHLQR